MSLTDSPSERLLIQGAASASQRRTSVFRLWPSFYIHCRMIPLMEQRVGGADPTRLPILTAPAFDASGCQVGGGAARGRMLLANRRPQVLDR
jgi:hypothetical protein